MPNLPEIPVCILAGGTSRRFGSNKALATLVGKAMARHVYDRLRPQTQGPIAINTNSDERISGFDLPIIPDAEWNGAGPLAGIASALAWASNLGAAQVVTVAVDLPFLPSDLVSMLMRAKRPSIAATQYQWHPVNGIWSTSQSDALEAYLQSGKRSAHGWAKNCKASVTNFEANANGTDPFWNVNTPSDLAEAEVMLKSTQNS